MCAITGVAGCGKTELAKAYTWEFQTMRHVFKWRLDPDTTNDTASAVCYQQAYLQLLRNFNIEFTKAYDSETPEQIRQRLNPILWNKIGQYPSWVIFFDNAIFYNDIKDYLPPGGFYTMGIILVTTQSPRFVKGNRLANFDYTNRGLDPEEAVELLKELSGRSGEDDVTTHKLVRQMDYSPLAIRVSGYYIHDVPQMTFNDYHELLEMGVEEELIQILNTADIVSQATQDNKRKATLHATLKLTIRNVEQKNFHLFEILRYCAYLSNENISLSLLDELCRTPDEQAQHAQQRLRAILIGCNNHSLLTYDIERDSCYLHQTTQAQIRHQLRGSSLAILQKLIAVINRLFPFDKESVEQTRALQKCSPHLLAILEHAQIHPELLDDRINFSINIGYVCLQFSQLTQAWKHGEEALRLSRSLEHNNRLALIESYRLIGYATMTVYDLVESSKNIALALALTKEEYGEKDISVADLYCIQGEALLCDPNATYEESMQLFTSGLQICQDRIPPTQEIKLKTQLGIQTTMSGLYEGVAKCLEGLEDFEGALRNLKLALETCKQWYDEDDPKITSIYYRIGSLGLKPNEDKFTDVGLDYKSSLEYVEKGLNANIKAYGYETINVANGLLLIGRMQYMQMETPGDLHIALENHKKAAETIKRIMGDQHHQLILTYYWQGKILEKIGETKQAMDMYGKAWKLQRHNPDHGTYTISRIGNHLKESSIRYFQDGHIDMAIQYQERLVDLKSFHVFWHNLACLYHVKAMIGHNQNDSAEFKVYIDKATQAFESGMTTTTNSSYPIRNSLYTEYAQFLIRHHETLNAEKYRKIVALLHGVIRKEDNSRLKYTQIEKYTVCEALQDILNQEHDMVIDSCTLAYYLLTKAHILYDKETAKEYLIKYQARVLQKREDGSAKWEEYLCKCFFKEMEAKDLKSGE